MKLNEIKENKTIEELLEFSIIILDKPKEFTSFDCVFKLKKILGVKKTGHFGTLDMNVTGVLPIAINKACRMSNFFMKKDKEYTGKMHLHKDISRLDLENTIKKFIGKINQLPPRRSSVKRALRERTVIEFKILEFEDKNVKFSCTVEAGTYIRKLIHDIGEKIGGAHMIELIRNRAGIFNEKNSYTFEEIESAIKKFKSGDEKDLRKILVPAEVIGEILFVVNAKAESVEMLLHGKPVSINDIDRSPESEIFAIFYKNKFIEIAKKNNEGEIIARPLFVLN